MAADPDSTSPGIHWSMEWADRVGCHDHRRTKYLRGLRDHIAFLHRAISRAEEEGLFDVRRARAAEAERTPSLFAVADDFAVPPYVSESSWRGPAYHLQMAASLHQIGADTAYVDSRGHWMWCGPRIEYENAHSDLASKYMAGLVVFNFVWMAYENVVEIAAAGRWPKKLSAAKARLLFSRAPLKEAPLEHLPCLIKIVDNLCQDRVMQTEIKSYRVRFARPYSAEAGADLCRIIRNHVAHGDDEVPEPGDGDHANLSVHRLFGATRILVCLIQILATYCLADPEAEIGAEWIYPDDGDQPLTGAAAFRYLHLEAPADQYGRPVDLAAIT